MPAEDTRSRLLARPDIPDADVDDIVARAAALQDADRAHDDAHATQAEVEAVAAELDIAPHYVDEAIDAIRRERQTVAERASERERSRSRALRLTGLGIAGLLVLLALGGGLGALAGSARLGSAAAEVDQAANRLDQALDRQIALAPQLVALAGADASSVKSAAAKASHAEGIDARLDAASTLNQAMAEAIGAITADGDAQAQQRLLNLQYEVVGTWNRIDTERGRFDEAEARWSRTANTPMGGLALTLGLASPPATVAP